MSLPRGVDHLHRLQEVTMRHLHLDVAGHLLLPREGMTRNLSEGVVPHRLLQEAVFLLPLLDEVTYLHQLPRKAMMMRKRHREKEAYLLHQQEVVFHPLPQEAAPLPHRLHQKGMTKKQWVQEEVPRHLPREVAFHLLRPQEGRMKSSLLSEVVHQEVRFHHHLHQEWMTMTVMNNNREGVVHHHLPQEVLCHLLLLQGGMMTSHLEGEVPHHPRREVGHRLPHRQELWTTTMNPQGRHLLPEEDCLHHRHHLEMMMMMGQSEPVHSNGHLRGGERMNLLDVEVHLHRLQEHSNLHHHHHPGLVLHHLHLQGRMSPRQQARV